MQIKLINLKFYCYKKKSLEIKEELFLFQNAINIILKLLFRLK